MLEALKTFLFSINKFKLNYLHNLLKLQRIIAIFIWVFFCKQVWYCSFLPGKEWGHSKKKCVCPSPWLCNCWSRHPMEYHTSRQWPYVHLWAHTHTHPPNKQNLQQFCSFHLYLSFARFFRSLFYFCTCAHVWLCALMSTDACRVQERFPGAESGCHELPNMGAKNWTQVSSRAVHALNWWVIPRFLLASFWLSDSILQSAEQSLILNAHF